VIGTAVIRTIEPRQRPQELGLEARTGADWIDRQLLHPPYLRIPFVLTGEVGAVVEHLLRGRADIHAVLDDCRFHLHRG